MSKLDFWEGLDYLTYFISFQIVMAKIVYEGASANFLMDKIKGQSGLSFGLVSDGLTW